MELHLSVDPVENPRARDWYARLGFRPLQTEPYPDHWQFADSEGQWHEGHGWAIDMVKWLRRGRAAVSAQELRRAEEGDVS